MVSPTSFHVGGGPRQPDPPIDQQPDCAVHREQHQRPRVPGVRGQRHLRAGLPQQRRNCPSSLSRRTSSSRCWATVPAAKWRIARVIWCSCFFPPSCGSYVTGTTSIAYWWMTSVISSTVSTSETPSTATTSVPPVTPAGIPHFLDSDFEFAFELNDVTQAITRFCQSSPRASSSHVLSALNGHRDVTPDGGFSVERRAVDRRDSRDCGEGRVSPRGYRRQSAGLLPSRHRHPVSTMKLPHPASPPTSSSTRCVSPPRERRPSYRRGSSPARS